MVQGSSFKVQGLRFKFRGSRFKFQVPSPRQGPRAPCLGFRFRFPGAGFASPGIGSVFKVLGSGSVPPPGLVSLSPGVSSSAGTAHLLDFVYIYLAAPSCSDLCHWLRALSGPSPGSGRALSASARAPCVPGSGRPGALALASSP